MSADTSGMSAAQQRAAKRNAKIRASAGERISKITTNSRGEEADYLKNDTPFNKKAAAPVPLATSADPDDIDLSLAAVNEGITPEQDPFAALLNNQYQQQQGPNGMPDLMALLSGQQQPGQDGSPNQLPPEFANNPLFAALAGMSNGQTNGQQQRQAFETEPANRTVLERLMPLIHLLSMLGLVAWAVWSSRGVQWAELAYGRDTFRDQVSHVVGYYRPLPLLYAFITVEMMLQSVHITLARRSTPSAGLLNSLIPMIPPPFGMYVATAMRYYTMFGQVLDDVSVLLFGIGSVIIYNQWRASVPES